MDKSVRRSQVITAHGPGGLLDVGQESFIAMDTSQWPAAKCRNIRLPRLELKVGASGGFKMPPTPSGSFDKNPPRIPYFRFPRWLFCPSCGLMVKWTGEMEKLMGDDGVPACGNCGGKHPPKLAPMRFILICKAGHIGDMNWERWAHSRSDVTAHGNCSHDPPRLRFLAAAGGASDLSSLTVKCDACGSGRDLGGIVNPGQLAAAGIHCGGRQPWQYFTGLPPKCGEEVRAEQRGSSNVYYSQVWSALDINAPAQVAVGGEYSEAVKTHQNYSALELIAESQENPEESAPVRMLVQLIADDLNISADEVIGVLMGERDAEGGQMHVVDAGAKHDILREEWPCLNRENDEPSFSTRIEPLSVGNAAEQELHGLIDKVVLVRKLREVRCLKGFTRVDPGGSDGQVVPPDLTGTRSWLPAVEVFGEGIFVAFNEDAVQNWAADERIGKRFAGLGRRFEESEGITRILPEPTPRLIMLHTFAHLLIRQLSFECGYGASSIRERIYSAEPDEAGGPMAGIMVYTADTDSEGSLGGLVRQGNADRFAPTVLAALDRSSWCSADPVCSEVEGQGLNGLNKAACHACALIGETSCTMFNSLLDRAMVVGGPDGTPGFFDRIIHHLIQTK